MCSPRREGYVSAGLCILLGLGYAILRAYNGGRAIGPGQLPPEEPMPSGGRAGLAQEEAIMDHPTTELLGRTVDLNPAPDNIADRLTWAIHNAYAIGASRSARGIAEMEELAKETGIPFADLEWFLDTIKPATIA